MTGALSQLARRLAHRGPDAQGFWGMGPVCPAQAVTSSEALGPVQVGLAHCRLRVLDLTTASDQPILSPDGRFVMVYNGEIYNYQELRPELAQAGWRFASTGDSEVLLAGLSLFGPSFLPRCEGMFALGLVDTHRRTLLLARDAFGIKPLYCAKCRWGLAFASEIAPLMELPGVDRRARAGAVYRYLRFGLSDDGQGTLLTGVEQVPPAGWLRIDLDDPLGPRTSGCHWDFLQRLADEPVRQVVGDLSEGAKELREVLAGSVSRQLRSDVPVGACLSGGIDSSSIVALCRQAGGAGLDLQAVAYVADDPDLCEAQHVRTAARSVGARVHEVRIAPEDLSADLDALIALQDLPFGSLSIYAQYRVFRSAREAGLTVMLDGQGADELLGGYRPFLAVRLASLIAQGWWVQAGRFALACGGLPGVSARGLLTRAAGLLLPARLQAMAGKSGRRAWVPGWLDGRWLKDRGVAPGPIHPRAGRQALREELVAATQRLSLPALLRYEDRNAMAFSLESRVPFCQTRLAELALSLPEAHLIGPLGQSKLVLRRAMEGLVPADILQRRDKIGFAPPQGRWLRAIGPQIRQILRQADPAQAGPLRMDRVVPLAEAMLSGRLDCDDALWRWANLIRWAQIANVSLQD